MTRGSWAWIAVSLLLGAGALAGSMLAASATEAIDWQPGLAGHEPWRAITAIGVHYSSQHLAVNMAGLGLTAALGVAAQMPMRLALAWLVAWPLTQIGLLMKPELAHYGGLSGVLHAGVAVVVVYLLAEGTRGQRWVAGAVALVGVGKLLAETPWGPALRHPAGWDIAIAPLAHTTGALAGAACAAALLALPQAAPPPPRHV